MIELALNNVGKYFGANQVLSNITFEVQTGERVGLVGRNGCGKSTILKIIAGIEQQDGGAVMFRKGSSVGYLDQIPNYPMEYKVIDVLNAAFTNLKDLEMDMKNLEEKMVKFTENELDIALKQYSTLQQKYEVSGGYEKTERLSKIISGLHFEESFLNQVFSKLSGGEKTTVVLGKILLEAPDVLLLDEPTNHLDLEALEWLENYLREYKGISIIVSHDRYFLDRVADKIVEIEDMESDTYLGNYTAYVTEKENQMMLQFEAFKEQEKKIKAMEKAIKDLRIWGAQGDNVKFFKRAASMEKRLAKIERIEKPVFEKDNIKLNITSNSRSGEKVIKANDISKAYNHRKLFEEAELLIRYGERAVMVGKNGSGKSTFIKILLGEEMSDKGSAIFGSNVRYGYLPQQVSFQDESLSVLECLREDINILEGKAREYLSKFMFYGNSVYKKVSSLSGGERSRLKLSKLLYEDLNVLIMDEPTNHLDIESIESLEEALLNFQGTIFFTSHDRYFINKIASRIIALEELKFNSYYGDYDYYRAKRDEAKQICKEKVKEKKEKPIRANIVDDERMKENKLIKLEVNISQIEEELQKLQQRMEEYSTDYMELEKCYSDKTNLENNLEELMKLWVELS